MGTAAAHIELSAMPPHTAHLDPIQHAIVDDNEVIVVRVVVARLAGWVHTVVARRNRMPGSISTYLHRLIRLDLKRIFIYMETLSRSSMTSSRGVWKRSRKIVRRLEQL